MKAKLKVLDLNDPSTKDDVSTALTTLTRACELFDPALLFRGLQLVAQTFAVSEVLREEQQEVVGRGTRKLQTDFLPATEVDSCETVKLSYT